MMRIPICPSLEVVFPGQLIAISHSNMAVEQAIRASLVEQQLVGIVYTSPHQPHSLCRIGTLARPVGRVHRRGLYTLSLVVVGQARFRMLHLYHDQPYPEATIQVWPWVQNPPPPWSMVALLGHYLKRYIAALKAVLPPALMPEAMAPNAATLGILGAALLQLPANTKQHLLEVPTTRELVRQVLRYMQCYVPLTERLVTEAAAMQLLPDGVRLN